MRRMAPAVSTSPATAVAATVRIVAHVSIGPTWMWLATIIRCRLLRAARARVR